MLSLIISFAAGIVLGIISGLIPGIHSNTTAGILLSASSAVSLVLGETGMAVCLITALIVHTFLDIIPGTFFGIPDADTALSVLPAHRMCLNGNGEEAVRISAVGSAYGAIFGICAAVLMMIIMPSIQGAVDWWSGIILIAAAGVIIVYSESPEWSFAVFMVSGILGIFAFHYSWLCIGIVPPSASSVLMPLLTGLFGISVLLFSKDGKMPEQKFDGIHADTKSILKCSILGTAAGSAVGWLPGLSNASANAVLASVLKFGSNEGEKERGFIVAASAANTANALISIAAFYAVSRMRNGVMSAFSHLSELPPASFIIAAAAAASFAGYILTIILSKSGKAVSGISVRKASAVIIAFSVFLTVIFTGFFGLFILILAVLIGVVPSLVNIRRVPCIAVVMLPVILYSFGIM